MKGLLKMKKIISIIIAVVAVFSLTTTTAFAYTDGTALSVDITAHQYSSFEITIPSSVNLNTTNGNIDIEVTQINLEPNTELGVYLRNKDVTLTHAVTNETASLNFYNTNGDLTNDIATPLATFTDIGNATIKAKLDENAKAGDYTGYAVFEIFTTEIN